MEKLSVVIIAFNEEKNIRAALESAKWADEIIVVDSFSTDGTAAICREYTDKVYQEKWRGFAAQKQFAVGLAGNDWVFVLDSDERFTPGLVTEIRGLLEHVPDMDGYHCARLNHFMGKEIRYGGWYPDYSVRLFDRRKGVFGVREVHESVVMKGPVGHLKNHMLHYTYTGIKDYLERLDRYSGLMAREMKNSGRRASVSDLTVRPVFTFFKMFIFKQGIRDGMYGLVIAMLYAFYTFTKYAKLWELEKNLN